MHKGWKGHAQELVSLAILMAFSASVGIAHASADAVPRKSITKIVKQYASAMGCDVVFDSRNIVKIQLADDWGYVVVYSMDPGCAGGNALYQSYFAVVSPSAFGSLFINAAYSSPPQTSTLFPKKIIKVSRSNGELWYRALDFDAAKDPACCPSVPVEGRLVFKKGKWQGMAESVRPPHAP